jgi:bifunctional enzyme CysN/CysC
MSAHRDKGPCILSDDDPAAGRHERPFLGATLWLTGLSGSGKSTLAAEVERRLLRRGRPAFILDGDAVRHGLSADLGFSPDDRAENVRRVGEVSCLFAAAGVVAVVALVSPYRRDRELVRKTHADKGLPYYEVFLDTPVEVCAAKDTKGLYAMANQGRLSGLTGVDAPYESPEQPDLAVRRTEQSLEHMAEAVLGLLDD